MATGSQIQLPIRPEPDPEYSSTSPQDNMDGGTTSPLPTILPSAGAASSPHNSRKRTNDEVYLPSQAAHTSPRNSEVSKRPSTAPEQSAFPQVSALFSSEQHKMSAQCSNDAVDSSIPTRSAPKPETTSISTNTMVENNRKFQDAIKEFQDQLDEEYKLFEQKLNERDQAAELEDFDWEELEARYRTAMDPKVEAEQNIMNECSHLFQHFSIWMQMSSERETDRSLKRLRTRMAFVQTSEEKLGEKTAHYSKVINAFHSAMALLGNI